MSEVDKYLDELEKNPAQAESAVNTNSSNPDYNVDDYLASLPAPDKGLGGHLKDSGLSLAQGIISVPESIVGLADIPTGGRVGKFLENEDGLLGFRPKQAREYLDEFKTEKSKAQQQEFADADGILAKTGVALSNPSMIANTLVESAPTIGLGGVFGRGALAGAKALNAGANTAKASVAAGAAGEGLAMAGAQAEQIRGETEDGLLTPAQSAYSLATGGLGTVFGYGGGLLAKRLGIGDVDTLITQGAKRQDIAGEIAQEIAKIPAKSIPRKVVEGAISEGFLEELPQSVSEQILQNLALDKDWSEGVDEAIVMGTLAGMAMGGGVGAVSSGGAQAADIENAPPAINNGQAQQEPIADGPWGEQAPEAKIDMGQMQGGGVTPAPVFNPQDIDRNLAPTPSQQMGINPDAGPISTAAALAVDGGATEALARQAAIEQQSALTQASAVAGSIQNGVNTVTGEIVDMPTRRKAEPRAKETNKAPQQLPLDRAEELQNRIDYFNQQAKITGWDKNLSREKKAAQDELSTIAAQAEIEQPAKAAPKAEPADDIKAIIAKQIPQMSDAELQQAADHYGPDHKRTAKLNREIAKRGITTQQQDQQTNGIETTQAEQASTQRTQAQTATGTKSAESVADITEGLTTVKTVYGDSVIVRSDDLASGKTILKTFTKDGKPKLGKALNRENIDFDGSKNEQRIKDESANPLFDTVTKQDGTPFTSKIAAGREMNKRGLLDTHEVTKVDGGYIVSKKQQKEERSVATPTYEQAKADVDAARDRGREASKVMATFPVGEMGLTPDAVKATPEWKKAKAESEAAFAQEQAANEFMIKNFRKENIAAIQAEREAKLLARQEKSDAPDYEQRKSDRIERIQSAKTPDEVESVLNEENQDGERHFQGTSEVAQKAQQKSIQLRSNEQKVQRETAQREFESSVNKAIETGENIGGLISSLESRLKTLEAETFHFADSFADSFAEGKRNFNNDPVRKQIESALERLKSAKKPEEPTIVKAAKELGKLEVVTVGDSVKEKAESVKKTAEPVKEKAEKEAIAEKDAERFAGNKLFTSDAVAKARERMRSKLGQLNSGIDPELLVDGMTIAGAYIESGVRKFSDYAKAMVEDLGDGVKPYLLSFWEGARNYPGLDTEGMTSQTVSRIQFEAMNKEVIESSKTTSEVRQAAKDAGLAAVKDFFMWNESTQGKATAKVAIHDFLYKSLPEPELKGAEALAEEILAEIVAIGDNAAAIGTVAEKPTKRMRKTGVKGDMVLTQDWGVPHIDGYGDSNDRETGNDTKDAFLKEARDYLNAVSDALLSYGYEPYLDRRGKAEKPVSVNEGGTAGSGDVSLVMQNPDNGNKAYITIGDTSLRGVVPSTESGIAIMYRVGPGEDRYASKYGNTWAPVDLSANELALLINSSVKPQQNEVTNEQPTDENAGQGRAKEVRNGGRDTQQGASPADRGDVGARQSTDGRAPEEAGSSGRPSIREPRADVAGNGPEPKGGDASDGRKGTGRAGSLDAGARSTAERNKQPDLESPAAASVQAQDLHIDNPLEIVGGTPVQRFNRNRAALELLQTLEVEGRQANPEEQKTLAAYIGWGSFGQELFQGSWDKPVYRDEGVWKSRGEWLRDTLGESAWKSAQRSITNAHYTDPPTVMAMWDMVKRMGFTGGKVQEPSMGTGNFFSMMPADLKSRSQLTGIELDETTGAIAKQLFPRSNIRIMGYQESKTPDGFYDLIIGNWPFENTPVADRRYNKLDPMLHDYFFLKTLDQVRAGGIVIGITSAGSMDKQNTMIRRELARKSELVASIRLPSGAFADYAGTKVVTDIVILRKRPERLIAIPKDVNWIETGEVKTPSGEMVRVNQYYIDNPQNIIGTLDYGSGTTTFRAGMIVHRPENMEQRLQQAIELVPADAFQQSAQVDHLTYYANESGERHGALALVGDKLMVAMGDQLVLANDKAKYEVKDQKQTADREAQLKGIAALGKLHTALVNAERKGDDAEPARKALNKAFKEFTSEHGPIRESFGLKYLQRIDDPYYAEIAALEGDDGKPAAVLERSTTRSRKEIKNPSVRDAYVLARNQSINPSIEEVAALAGKSPESVKQELMQSGAVFEAPNGDIVPSDIYLSGNVRQKMREAQAGLAEGNKAMEKNVRALEEVMPADVPYFNIETKLGATWVSPQAYAQYVANMLSSESTDGIEVAFRSGRWSVKLHKALNNKPEASANYGTVHASFSRLVQAAMSNQTLRLTSKDADGNESYDPAKTEEVNARIAKIRDDFGTWLWSDPERRVDMELEYNEARNAWSTPKYDGSFLTFEGMALTLGKGQFNLREHQVNAIWRGIVNRRSLNAHEVGTGKTFTMAGIAVESRRYGIAKKPVLLAHNANSATVAAEIRQMYPQARVLYVDNLDPKNRAIRLRQIANDDWDVIVMPHSLIDRLSLREETLMEMAADDIAALESEFLAAAEDDGIDGSKVDLDDDEAVAKVRSVTAKELAKARKRIIENIKKQSQQASKEGAVSFEELGIDMVLVDEVHEFKKPPIVTRMQMKGLNTQVSGRSIALQFLTRYVRQMNNGGNVHTFTGTPITNTITEIYHQMRYVMENEMDDANVADWDGWFGSFATEVQDVELSAAGDYEMVTRLAGFVNVPELRQMVGQYMDTVFADDMPEMQPRKTKSGKQLTDETLSEAERIELLNGRTEGAKDRPYKKVINASADMTARQQEVFSQLQGYAQDWRNASGKERRELMRTGDPRSPIVTEGIATKASFDVRLLDESLAGMEGKTKDDPNSKASRVVNNVLEIYKSNPLAGQVVFAEMGFSKSVRRTRTGPDGEKTTTTVKVFSTIHDVIERLVQGGIPRDQIALVDGSVKKERRREIAEQMNSGKLRVVLGSTDTLGVGVNMQKNLRAMHHMDAPYMPGELEQRNGRGQRQGNQWNTVLEYRYMTDRLDGRRWQILAVKQRFITAFMKANNNARVIEGEAAADEQSDILESFSEAAGDPRILQRVKLQKKEESLKRKERMYTQGISGMRRQARNSAERATQLTGRLEKLKQAGTEENIQKLITSQREAFKATIDGKSYDTRADSVKALESFAASSMRLGDGIKQVGTYAGHPVMMEWPGFHDEPTTTIKAFGEVFSGKGIAGAEARMRNYFKTVEADVKERDAALATAENMQKAMQQPFAQADELDRVSKQLKDLEKDLEVNPVPPPAWLRQGAPMDSEVFWNKKPYVVTGHRYTATGWFVVADDDKGSVLIPYMEAKDPAGMELYEEREFTPPEVQAQRVGADDSDDGPPILEKGSRYDVVSFAGSPEGPWKILTEGGFSFANTQAEKFATVDEAVEFAKNITGKDPEARRKGWSAGNDGVKFSFAGQTARGADVVALDNAKVRIASGDDAETVRQETGWHRGDDGKWRFEISDDQAKLRVAGKTAGEVIDSSALDAIIGNRKFPVTSDLIDHSQLFVAYPKLSNIKVEKMPAGGTALARLQRRATGFTIQLRESMPRDKVTSAILHELQHGIQVYEGFAVGGSKSIVFSDLDFNGAKAYRLLAGEVEARNTQTRQTMTPNLRRNIAPEFTQDTLSADVLVTFNGKDITSKALPNNASMATITNATLVRAFDVQFPRLGKAVRTMLARGNKGERGGVVVIDSADPLMIARAFAKKTGKPISQSVQMFSDAGVINGFFDPKSGLTFLVGPNLNPVTGTAVLLHEMIHGQQRQKIDRAALSMLMNRGKEKNAETRAFLDRVAARMDDAGETANAQEAGAYIVEQAVMEGKSAGYGTADSRFLSWVDQHIGKTVGDFLRSFIGNLRSWALRNGLPIGPITVDDLVSYAMAGMEQAGRGNVDGGVQFSKNATEDRLEGRRQFQETEKAYGGRAAYNQAKSEGKTKLNYQQWVQVRTPAFKEWFGDWEDGRQENTAAGYVRGVRSRPERTEVAETAKNTGRSEDMAGGRSVLHGATGRNAGRIPRTLIDGDTGEPRVFYHGTSEDIAAFELDHSTRKDAGWLGRGVYVASNPDMARMYANTKWGSAAPNIMPLFVRSTGELYVATIEQKQRGSQLPQGEIDKATRRLIKQGYDGAYLEFTDSTELVTYYANNVKSASGNVGTFSAATDDISFSRAQTKTAAFKKQFGDSKVVDVSGDPLLVYHGSGAKFATFDKNKRGATTRAKSAEEGFFFTSSKSLAYDFKKQAEGAAADLDAIRSAVEGLSDSQLESLASDIGRIASEDLDLEGREFFIDSLMDMYQYDTDINTWPEESNGTPKVLKKYIPKDILEPGAVHDVYLRIENPHEHIFSVDDDWHDEGAITRAISIAKKNGNDGVILRNMVDVARADEKGNNAIRSDVYIAFEPDQIIQSDDSAGIRFSRSGFKGIASKATYELNKTFNAPSKLSKWHTTVGTMNNLAQRSPYFKPVFEAAQGFIDDVAYYAADAAELAGKLLPKLETWKDIAKKPISAADNAAIEKPINEGTLVWTRDASGKPVRVENLATSSANMSTEEKARELMDRGMLDAGMNSAWKGQGEDKYAKLIDSRYESKMLKAGIVWTPAELKSMFGLTDGQAGLYQEFRAAVDRSLDTMGRADMLRFGGEDLKPLRQIVMDEPDIQSAARLLVAQLSEMSRKNPDRETQLMQTAHGIMERAAKVAELQADGYAPLSRFGKYTIDVVENGERQYFGLFETAREANAMAEKMRAEFGADSVTQGTLSDESYKLFAGITPESLELFGNMLGLDSDGDTAQDQAFQEYLRLTKTNRSAMRRLIHRKGIAGFSSDVGRVLASFVYSNARQTSAGLNMGDLGDAISKIPKQQGELTDVAVRLSEYIKNPQEEAQAVRGLLFAQYLGGSVASAFVNITQPFAVTFPWLSQHGGARKAAAEIARAAKDMSTKGKKYEADLSAALKAAEDDGTVSPQEVHQLMAQARGSGSLGAGDGTRLGDARAAAKNSVARLSLAWGKLFGAAEQVNRRVTFIAAFRVARDQGIKSPAEFAREAVRETQFIYSKANKMQWGRGAVGGTLMTFKTYSVAYIELMHRLWNQGEKGSLERKEGRKAAMLMIATLMLMGGAGGLPFAEDAEDLIDGAAQLMGYNFSAKKAKEQFLIDVFGESLAEFVDKGVSGLPGSPMDVSGRLGLGNLIPGTGLFTERTSHSRDLLEIAGPAGDLASRALSGTKKILGGDIGAGVTDFMPTAVRNAMKGVDMAATGMYRDTKGYKVLDTNMLEAALKGVGFQPKGVSKVQEANWLNQREKNFYSMKAQEIRAQWAAGIFEKDAGKVQAARDAVNEWNRKNPDQRIVIRIPDVMRRVREMAKSKDQRIADTAPKAMRARMREESARMREELN